MKALILSFLVATTLVAGAQDSSIKLPIKQNSVKILSVSPGIEKELVAGTTVTLKVELEYNLVSAESATVTLVVQRSESGHMPLANEMNVIKKGQGKTTISTDIKVPQTKAIQIFTPLLVQGSTQTTTVDSRVYSVSQ